MNGRLARKGVHVIAHVRHRNRDGEVIWEETIHNIFHDEGEEYLVKVAFSEELSVPATHYIGLDARTTLAEADTLSSLAGEPSGNGYARQAVNTDNTDYTASQESGDWQAATKIVTFAASGGSIGPVDNCFLCDAASGTTGDLYCSLALSQERTLGDGEELDVSMTIKVSE
jgi:hypothetical protein